MVTILIIVLLLAFISGAPLFTIMLGALGIGAAASGRGFEIGFNGGVSDLISMGLGNQGETLATIPMFIYAGYLLAEAKTADRLVRFANAALGWMPGGLAIVTILTCALFTVFTGASGVTIIALGGVLMPALVKNGYPERFSMGLIAGTGSVGLLFPPALPLFVYGAVYGLQQLDKDFDTQRFIFAGIVPGFVLVGMLSAVAVTVALIKKLPRQKFDIRELAVSFIKALPELFIPFGVLLGLKHKMLPGEMAALTVLYVVVLEVGIYKMLKPKVLWTTCREAMAMVGAIFIIMFCATAFTNYLINAEVPQKLVEWTKEHVDSRIVFLLALNVILLIVGTVMDIFSAIVIILPLIARTAQAYGIDPYHLGVIFLLNLEVGYLHPPVGLNLFITSVKFQRPITEVMWATIPFLITMIVALLTITYIPQLTVVPAAEVRGLDENAAVPEVALVASDGTPLKDDTGKPLVVKKTDCDALQSDKKDACANVFFYAAQCKADPKPDECVHHKIASYAKRNMQLVLQREIPLIDDDKNPVKDSSGNPIVKKFDDCAKETDKEALEACRALFFDVSGCKIDPGDTTTEKCTFNVISKYARDNPP